MAAVAACMFVSNVFAQRIKRERHLPSLKPDGSRKLHQQNKSAKITVTGGGSGVGISALMEGTTDIAMSSRKMKFDEKSNCRKRRKHQRSGDRLRRTGSSRTPVQ